MEEDDLSIQILGMKREDCFAVVALDMDVWGYGESAESAMQNMVEHVTMQLLYLIRANKAESVRCAARTEFYDMYNECFIARIKQEVVPDWWISRLSIPLPHQNHNSLSPDRTVHQSSSGSYVASSTRTGIVA